MSPRIKRIRKITNPPIVKGFKPYGHETGKHISDPVMLLYEEYEALRLCDYDMYNHIQASEIMNVSRPTYTRIYSSARKKIAKAFVEGRQIAIEGGKVYFDSEWFQCNNCHCYFNNPEKEIPIKDCPLCQSHKIKKFNTMNNEVEGNYKEDICICPDCGFELKHQHGVQCKQQVCPECNSLMKRKGTPYCRNI